MRREDYVSLWLCNLDSIKSLEKYMDIRYTRDGDMIPSKFAKIFKIDRYDDDFREAKYFEESHNQIDKLLENFSYDHVLLKFFKKLVGEQLDTSYNTVILLYNFEYDGKINEVVNSNEEFKFMGSTKYRNLYVQINVRSLRFDEYFNNIINKTAIRLNFNGCIFFKEGYIMMLIMN